MKIDRLIGIIMYLLNRNIVSARELADKFEVSVRTIVRDVEALSITGIPISSTTGASGGYEILDTFMLNKQITNMDDYLSVIMALKSMCSAYDNKKLVNTLEKLLVASKHKDDGQRVFLDFGIAREGENIPEYVKTFEDAICAEKIVEFDYTDSGDKTNRRIVEPLALTYKWYAWYLFGYCTYKKDYRIFKLNRISEIFISKTQLTHKHPDIAGLLEKQWNSDSRTYWDIKLLCRYEVKMPVVEYLKGKVLEEYENGDFIISLHLPENERMWFSLLLGFGDRVKVLKPILYMLHKWFSGSCAKIFKDVYIKPDLLQHYTFIFTGYSLFIQHFNKYASYGLAPLLLFLNLSTNFLVVFWSLSSSNSNFSIPKRS